MPNYVVGEQYTEDELKNIGLYNVVAVIRDDGRPHISQVFDLVRGGSWDDRSLAKHKVTVGEGLELGGSGVTDDGKYWVSDTNSKGKWIVVARSGHINLCDEYGSDGVELNSSQMDDLFDFLKRGQDA